MFASLCLQVSVHTLALLFLFPVLFFFSVFQVYLALFNVLYRFLRLQDSLDKQFDLLFICLPTLECKLTDYLKCPGQSVHG